MSKKWPNTDHWQRVKRVFRFVYASKWRAKAAAEFKVASGEVRAFVDQDLQPWQIRKLDNMLIKLIERRTETLKYNVLIAGDIENDLYRALLHNQLDYVFVDNYVCDLKREDVDPWLHDLLWPDNVPPATEIQEAA